MPKHPGRQKTDELGWHMAGSVREVADILEEFARELRGGDVNVWKGQRELHLNPEGPIELRVEAHHERDGREALSMRLTWDTD